MPTRIEEARAQGYTDEEIGAFVRPKVQEALDNGYSQDDINKYLGIRQPDNEQANTSLASSIANAAVQDVADIATITGPVEAAISISTGFMFGFPAYLGAAVGGIGRTIFGDGTLKEAKQIAEQISSAVTYMPQTEAGQRLTETTLYPLTKLGEAGQAGGKKVADVTDSPVAAAITEATIQMLPIMLLGSLARKLSGKTVAHEEIHDAARQITKDASPKATAMIETKLTDLYEKTGVDPKAVMDAARTDPTVIPDLMATKKALQTQRGSIDLGLKPPQKPINPTQQAILDRIVPGDSPSRLPTWHEIYTRTIDDLHPLKMVEAGKNLKTADSPYALERLTRGMFGKGEQFIKHGAYDFNTYKNVGKSYEQLLKPVENDLDGFRAYMVSRRAIEQAGKGLETGVPIEQAKAVVAQGKAKYEPVFQDRLKYKDTLLENLVESGILSKESATTIREANKAHVPFYRFFEEETRPVSGKNPRNPIRKFIGSEREIIDPIESDIKDTFLFISLAEKNAARQAFVKLGPEYATKVKTKMRPIDVTDKEITKAMKEQGIDGNPDSFSIFRPSKFTPAPDEISVFENGKMQVYKVDPAIAEAINGMDHQATSFLTNMLNTPAQLLRAGITVTPDFAMRNMIRDSVSAFIYTGSHPIKTLRGAVSYFGKDEAFQNWQKGGGANATVVAMDRKYISENVYDLNAKVGAMQKTWNVVRTPYEILQIMSETMENVTRLGSVVDEMSIAKNKAQIQALSLISREATVDFARHGSDPFLRSYTRMTAFMNPGLQGIDRMARAMKDNPVGSTAKAFASITIPSLLLWWANHDDPRYQEIPDWERDLFWIVMTEDHIYRIPKDFQWGIIFGSLPERLMDKYFTDNPDAFHGFVKGMKDGFQFNMMPTFAVPPMEQVTNYSFFKDRPLIPSSMEKILPEYQYSPYTTELTKKMGEVVGSVPSLHDKSIASPLIIDNYIRGWSGTLGTYAVQLADLALRKTGVLPDPTKPTQKLEDMPIIRAFMIRHPSASAQSIQNFYESYNKSNMVLETIKQRAKLGDMKSIYKEMALEPMIAPLSGIHQSLSTAQTFIMFVNNNQQMNPDEKRQLIDSTYYQMIEMANAGNKAIAEMTKTTQGEIQ